MPDEPSVIISGDGSPRDRDLAAQFAKAWASGSGYVVIPASWTVQVISPPPPPEPERRP
jgi:hypothetical protein